MFDEDDDQDRAFCPSCHTFYCDHHGLIRTCHDLQKAKADVELLKKALADMIDAADESRPCVKVATETMRKVNNG